LLLLYLFLQEVISSCPCFSLKFHLFFMQVFTDLLENFGVDWPKFLAQVILFLIVYFILRRFAFGPVIKMLEERRRRIEEGERFAEKMKKQLAEAELRYEEVLKKAHQDAQALVEEAREAAQANTQKELQRAVKDADALIKKAHEAIELDRHRMVDAVKKEMVRLIVTTTAKVAGKVLTPEDQNRLTAEASEALKAS
jgi:F-type H+-transporting ATPase subunit b